MAGKPQGESRVREEESATGEKDEPYVFKIEKRFDFKNFDPRNWGNWMPLALALAAGYMLTHSSGQPRQISWQEFRINYLERGEVERLEVVNRSLVRAYLRRDSAGQVHMYMYAVHLHCPALVFECTVYVFCVCRCPVWFIVPSISHLCTVSCTFSVCMLY